MNCIDAVEGTVKQIITRLHDVSVKERLEDTEYIQGVKTILEGTNAFLTDNLEVIGDPEIVHAVLLTHARELWLRTVLAGGEQAVDAESRELHRADREYLIYYFDYIYQHGYFPL